jgi:hypothetical protein
VGLAVADPLNASNTSSTIKCDGGDDDDGDDDDDGRNRT